MTNETMNKKLNEVLNGEIVERGELVRMNKGTAVRGYKVRYKGKVYAVIAVNGEWAYCMEIA